MLGDQFDTTAAALLPPAATARYLNVEFAFGWVGLRLRAGPAGIPALQRELAGPQDAMDRAFHLPAGTLAFNIRRLDTVHQQVQQAIEPQAVALALFGGLAALALLVLAGQALAQLLSWSAASVPVMRAVGATRAQAALATSLDGSIAILGGMALAVAGAVAVSPLAPIGPVRAFDPARGFQADPLVLAGGGGALAAFPAGRPRDAVLAVDPPGSEHAGQQNLIDRPDSGRGRPAGDRGGGNPGGAGARIGSAAGSCLATLVRSAVAVLAVVMAAVFGASLNGLVTHPARYGWNWTLLMETQGAVALLASVREHRRQLALLKPSV